ncbi:MAG: MBL fold metallo-hydrolase [Coprobacillus sp.]
MKPIIKNSKGQAVAGKTQKISKDAFSTISSTEVRWLSSAGIMINSHGTTFMIDPLLEGFDMDLLVEMPILPQDIPELDAILITHCDNDHFSRMTCNHLKDVCRSYHGPQYVAELMKEEGINGVGHDIDETFELNSTKIKLTPADHAWQNEKEKYRSLREYKKEDYCGYWIETVDGTIWLPGDSRLLEEQLHMEEPKAILFDFSDNEWHIGLNNAIKLANAYPNSDLLLIHWGSVDAPAMNAFNGNPEDLYETVVNPERIKVLAPGEVYIL